jgi:hypothetical protein
MQKEVLLERVRVAAEAYRAAIAPHTLRIEQVIAASTDPGFAAAKAPLVAHLATEPELAIFDDSLMIVFRNSASRASYAHLAQWLADRAATVGEQQAVEELERYLREPRFEYKVFGAIAGMEVADETRFTPDLVLSGPDALPKYVLDHNPLSIQDWHRRPTAALTLTRSQARQHAREGEVKHEDVAGANDPIDDALMCISVVGAYAPVLVGVWYDVLAAPVPGGFGELPISLEMGWAEKLSKADASAAAALYTTFAGLATQQKERLRVPMRRLNASRRRRDQADSAIDLGIALESVFGDEDPGEYTFKVRVRAARFLGLGSADRERIYELAGDLYLLRSIAVHKGTLKSSRTKGMDIGKTLKEGQQLVGDVLKTLIHNPVTDWRSTVLS